MARARHLHNFRIGRAPEKAQRNEPMNAEQHPGGEPTHFQPLYFVALLESQMIARRALWRLERLYLHYPDQALREAIEALRRADDGAAESPAIST